MSLAALLHGALLAALLAGQVWGVNAVPLPPESAVFVTWAPPPPPLPEPPRTAVSPPAPPERRNEPVAPVPIVPPTAEAPVSQPTDLLEDRPVSAPSTVAGEGAVDPGPGPAGDGEPEDGGFLRYTVGMTAPAVLSRVEPVYTEPARRAGRQGVVVLQAAIGRDGDVVHVDVVKTLGFGLDEEAIKAVRRWRFAPARRNGDPVGVLYTITVRYTLVR
jgi:protein TonB